MLVPTQEVNDLVQLFISIGENLPQHPRRQQAANSSSPDKQQLPNLERQDSASGSNGVEFLSLLDSCRLSIDEIIMNSSGRLPFAGQRHLCYCVMHTHILHVLQTSQ